MKSTRIILVLVLLLALPALSQARDKGFNLGASVGFSNLNEASVFLGTPDIDKSGTGFRFVVGWKFNENFGLEAAYSDLGGATISGGLGDRIVIGDDIITFQQNGVVVDRDVSTINLSLAFFHDFNKRVAVLGRVGMSRWDIGTTSPAGSLSPELNDDDGSGFHVGVGLGVKMAKHWDFEIDLEYYLLDELDVVWLTTGVVVTF